MQLAVNVESYSSVSAGQTLLTLPAGWGPGAELDVACVVFDGVDYPMAGWLAVMPDGRVSVKEYLAGGRKGLQVKGLCRFYAA